MCIGIQHHEIRECIGLKGDDVFDFLFLCFVQVIDECAGGRDSSGKVFASESVERNRLEMLKEFRPRRIHFKSPVGKVIDRHLEFGFETIKHLRVLKGIGKKALFRGKPVDFCPEA